MQPSMHTLLYQLRATKSYARNDDSEGRTATAIRI